MATGQPYLRLIMTWGGGRSITHKQPKSILSWGHLYILCQIHRIHISLNLQWISRLGGKSCRGSIFSFNPNKESRKEKEKIREKINTGGNPVVLQPTSDQHVLLHSSLLPSNILLINDRSVLTITYFLYLHNIFKSSEKRSDNVLSFFPADYFTTLQTWVVCNVLRKCGTVGMGGRGQPKEEVNNRETGGSRWQVWLNAKPG